PSIIGARGEVHVGGAGLARGYINRPDLTAERFGPNAFAGQPGARLYKTGDIGRYLPSGHIQHAGRRDHQVKIRGFRIELGEVQSAIKQAPNVRDAIVTVYSENSMPAGLVAYVVAQDRNEASAMELRQFLANRLPY